MAYRPLISGASTVEITAVEYEVLIRKAEKTDTVERLIKSDEYVTLNTIKALLDIEEERKSENE